MSNPTSQAEAQTAPNPNSSMEELFSRDPNKWSNDDVASIVAYYRGQRKNFLLAEEGRANNPKPSKAAAAKPLAGAPKAPKPAKAIPGQISLASLGITFNPKPPEPEGQ